MKIGFGSEKIDYDWIHLMKSYKKYVTKKSTVLEIGASTTERTVDLSRSCKKLIGIELMPERKPVNHGNVKYFLGDWQELSKIVKQESIDVAVSSHVIEHVPDDLKSINELYNVLKPNGVAIVNTPNRKRLTRSIIEIFTEERKFPYWEHVREYTEDDLINLIKKSKFKKFKIIPVVFGIHGGHLFVYSEQVPKMFRKQANFWEIHLFK